MITYKPPGKIKISKERKVDIIDILDDIIGDIANDAFFNPKLSVNDSNYENIANLNDIHRELQGIDFIAVELQKLKIERTKEANNLLKKIIKK
jgi:hypothetical protein